MPRDTSRTAVSFDVLVDFSSGRREARVSNLSVTGCFIETTADAREGEVLSLTLKIADDKPLALRGVVIYTLAGTGFGVQFIDLGASEISLLGQAILMNSGDPLGRD